MKLNFWQWLGLALLIFGVAMWAYQQFGSAETPVETPAETPEPTTLQAP